MAAARTRLLRKASQTVRAQAGVGLGLGLGLGLALVDTQRPLPSRADGETAGAAPRKPSFREQVVGSYEDRIRNFSSPEKVFEFFASVNTAAGSFMTAEDFARAITPYQQRPGVELGSKNFKYNFQAMYQGPTPEGRAKYKEVLRRIVEDDRVTPEEVKELLEARKRYGVTSEAHLEVLSEMGISAAYISELMEARGGLPRSKLMAMVDTDGDGLLSYEEFMLFHTLLAIPVKQLHTAFRMFDLDGSGTVDLREFKHFMAVLRGRTNAGRVEVARRHDRTHAGGSLKALFGEDGDQHLTLGGFVRFVNLLREETLRMQFSLWDEDQSGELSAWEFARFLATKMNADRHLYKAFLERAESEALVNMETTISVREFLAFHEFLTLLGGMEVAMQVLGSDEQGGLTKAQFLQAARATVMGSRHSQQARLARGPEGTTAAAAGTTTAATGASAAPHRWQRQPGTAPAAAVAAEPVPPGVSEGVADVLFALFDQNGDGLLDAGEFVTVMEKQAASVDMKRDLGVVEMLASLVDCARQELA